MERILKIQYLEDRSLIIKEFDEGITGIYSCQDSVDAAKYLFTGLLESLGELKSKTIQVQIKEIEPLIV